MHIKTLILGIILSTATLFAEDGIGRYQLVAATVEVGGEKVAGLFKIDTKTGDVFRYNSVNVAKLPNGTFLGAEGFTKIEHDLNTAIDTAKESLPAAIRAVKAAKP